jgi:hypothetical protein
MEQGQAENMKSILIYEKGFSTLSDIVWSFDYYLENIAENTEFAFTFFLQDANIAPASRSSGVDLGYSSNFSLVEILQPFVPSTYLRPITGTYYIRENTGLEGGLLGVGFDSTGCFALSSSIEYDIYRVDGITIFLRSDDISTFKTSYVIRDGKAESDRIPNSVTMRGPGPEYGERQYYGFNQYGVNYALTGFPIVDGVKKTVRARLGNLGRTFYVDFRRTPDEQFINILKQDVILPTTRYPSIFTRNASTSSVNFVRPGITITKPISSTLTSAAPTVIIENFHVEGSEGISLISDSTLFESLTSSILPVETSTSILTGIELPIPPDTISLATPPPELFYPRYLPDRQDIAAIITPVVSGSITGYSESAIKGYDVFNFGYVLSAGGYPLEENIIMYRIEQFKYQSLDGVYNLNLESFNGVWKFTYSDNTYLGDNKRPVGDFKNSALPLARLLKIAYI